jgi:hypothetical protein
MQDHGKTRAVSCRIEGVVAKSINKHTPRIHRKSSAPKSKVVSILAVIAIGAFAYQRLDLAPPSILAQQTLSSPSTEFSRNTNSQFFSRL